VRRGDREVKISVAKLPDLGGRTPVLVDDIIASGRTMIEAVRLITPRADRAPVCIGVHGLFAEGSDALLARAGARVVTCNSVPHPSNAIDVGPFLVGGVRELQARP
jgi:ribose-phosphate pyrophosphokinase